MAAGNVGRAFHPRDNRRIRAKGRGFDDAPRKAATDSLEGYQITSLDLTGIWCYDTTMSRR